MDHQPRITVGIPIYNGADWIGETAASLLGQTFSDLEVVICDNASQDNTREVCLALAERDPRVRYFRNERNLGAPQNFNRCLDYARGEYFKWNSASDLCLPTLLERCIEALESAPDAVLAYSRTQLLWDDGRLENTDDDMELNAERPSDRFIRLTENIGLNHVMNGVIRRDALMRTALHGAFYSSDICLMAELCLYGKFVQIPEYLFQRRNSLETASSMRSGADLQQYIDPGLDTKMLFQNLKLFRAYYRAVRRAPICKTEKRVLYRYLLKRVRWSRYQLLGDVVYAVKKTLGRA